MSTKNLRYIGRRLTSKERLMQAFQDEEGETHFFSGIRYAFVGYLYPVEITNRGKDMSMRRKAEPVENSKAPAAQVRKWEAEEMVAEERYQKLRSKEKARKRGPELLEALAPLGPLMKEMSLRDAEALVSHVCMEFWRKNGGRRIV